MHDDDPTEDTRFEELGRRAGAELRRPADEDALDRVARDARRRRVATIAAGAATVAIALIAIGLFTSPAPEEPTVAATTTTRPGPGPAPVPATTILRTATTTDPTTTDPTTTEPTPVSPTTTASSTASGDTVVLAPAESPAASGTPATRAFALPSSVLAGLPGVRFLPDGESFLVGDVNGHPEYVVDTDTGEVLQQFPGAEVFSPKFFSPDGSLYYDGRVLWDMTTRERLLERTSYGAALSPDRRWLAVRDGPTSALIELIDARDGSVAWSVSSVAASSASVFPPLRFSDDGAVLYVGEEIHDVATGALLPGVAPPAVAPTAGFWDPRLVETLAGPYEVCDPDVVGNVSRCDISADGFRVAMISPDATIVQIWELEL